MDPVLLVLLIASVTQSETQKVTTPCPPCHCRVTNNAIMADCSNLGINGIPSSIPNNTTHLDMSKNKINELQPRNLSRFHNLRVLDFSMNKITSLHSDSFVGVVQLRRLILHSNSIPLSDQAFSQGLFRQQKMLITLDISKNRACSEGSYPGALSDLVSLQTLYIDGITNATFGQGFARLEKLTTLSLSGRRGHCTLYNLFNHSFVNTPSLTSLDVSKCSLLDIDINTFGPLKNIDTLDLSENVYLGFDTFGDSMYGLQFSPLRVLKINSIVVPFAIGICIREDHLRYLKYMSVVKLYADHNRIELMEAGVPALSAGLEIVSMKNARFTFGEYILALDKLTNLRKIYFNDQYESEKLPLLGSERKDIRRSKRVSKTFQVPCSSGVRLSKTEIYDKQEINKTSTTKDEYQRANQNGSDNLFSKTHKKYQSTLNDQPFKGRLYETQNQYDVPAQIDAFDFLVRTTIPLPPNVTFVNSSNCKLNYDLFEMRFTKNHIKHVDLSNNFLSRWIGPIHEAQHVEYLDLSNNYCGEIAPSFLQFANGLKILNISKNLLETSLHNDTNGQIFSNQTELEVLRIAFNRISELPTSVFQKLTKLKVLDLSWNMMETWTTDISHMTLLQSLNLAKNRLQLLPRNLREQINTIMENRNDIFSLCINTNNLKCDCGSLHSLEWMLKPYIAIDDLSETQCQLQDGTNVCMQDLEDIVLKLRQQCKAILPIILSSAIGVLVFSTVAVAGVIYRYRWKLRYLYYITRRKYKGFQRLTEEANFSFDAFVSYADEDRGFVVSDMHAVLEERFGLKLCIHQRDFMVGEPITANIINAIQSSRKTIVVLSPDFVSSSWCEYEVRMAKLESIHTGRDVLCVVWYADVPDRAAITGDLLEEILNDTYIKYPGEEQDQEVFWNTLKDSLQY